MRMQKNNSLTTEAGRCEVQWHAPLRGNTCGDCEHSHRNHKSHQEAGKPELIHVPFHVILLLVAGSIWSIPWKDRLQTLRDGIRRDPTFEIHRSHDAPS